MGFARLRMLPHGRWSLTPPFHPYRLRGGFFLLHCPGSRLRRTLSGILPCGARTFLPHFRAGVCPSHSTHHYTKNHRSVQFLYIWVNMCGAETAIYVFHVPCAALSKRSVAENGPERPVRAARAIIARASRVKRGRFCPQPHKRA